MSNDSPSQALPEALRARLDQVAGLLSSGQTPAALNAAVDALRAFPNSADLLNLAGICAATLGQNAQAAQYWKQTIALNPTNAQPHFNLGLLYANARRHAEAEPYYRKTVELDPRNAQAWFNLGVLLATSHRETEAEHCYRQVISLDPNNALPFTNLGILLAKRKQMAEAEQCYRKALALNPSAAEAYNNLGLLLEEQQRLDEAEQCYKQAIALNPSTGIAQSNLALLLTRVAREEEAEQYFQQAIALNPGYAIARLNYAFLLLRQGRFKEGWSYHETRLDPTLPAENRHPHPINATFPQWRGESLAGKSLMIWPEQGFGDEIQFCRYVGLLKKQGARKITLVCKPPLKKVMETLEGVDSLLTIDEIANPVSGYDYWTYPLSIPLHCQTELSTIPNHLPYLQADAERIAKWSARIPSDGLRVGLVWKGSATHSNDANRSLPGLAALAPLWDIPGVHFIGLQKGQGEDEALQLAATQPLLNLGPDLTDFADTAALASQLDLIISVDTAVVHLAGALAKPCWVLLPAQRSDWRWLKDRTDSPWYPGVMRLFRQGLGETWEPTILALQAALRDKASPPSK